MTSQSEKFILWVISNAEEKVRQEGVRLAHLKTLRHSAGDTAQIEVFINASQTLLDCHKSYLKQYQEYVK